MKPGFMTSQSIGPLKYRIGHGTTDTARSLWPRVAGPLLLVGVVVLIEALAQIGFKVPNPPALLLLVVVYATFVGGFWPGFISAGLAWLYIAWFFSLPAEPFHYTDENLLRVVVWGLTTPLMAWMVGILERRSGLLAELQQKNVELRKSEIAYQDLYENAPDMYVSVNPSSASVLRCNQTLIKATGYTREEIIGRPIFELYHPDCMPALIKAFKSFETTGEVHNTELQLRRKDGSRIEVYLRASAVRDGDGRILYSRSSLRDITERKRAEEALRESEERFVTFMNNTSVLAWIKDEGLRYVYCNRAFERQQGIALAALRGQDDFALWPREMAQALRETDREVLQSGTPLETQESVTDRHGRLHHAMVFKFPFRNSPGGRQFVGGMAIDITARKQAEEEKAALQARSQALVQALAEIVYEWRPQTNEVHWAGDYTRILGYSTEEIGRDTASWGSRIHPDHLDEVQREIENAKREGRCFDLEYRFRRRDGSYAWMQDRGVLTLDADGNLERIDGVFSDITARKQTEAAMQANEERFRRLIEHAPEAIVLLDMATGRFVLANPAAERLFKLPADKLCQFGPVQVSPPLQPDGRPSSEKATEFLARVHAGEAPVFEWTHRDAKGRDIPCEVRLLQLEIGGREIVRGSVTDITERKQAEVALRESEGRLRIISALTSDYAFSQVIAPDGSSFVEWISEAFTKITGYTLEDIRTPDRWINIIHPDDRVSVVEYNETNIAGRAASPIDFRLVRKDGGITWLRVYMQPLRDDQGRVARLVGAAQDITERKQADVALRRSEQSYSTLVKNIVGAVYRCRNDPNWTTDFISDGCLEITGYRPAELLENGVTSLGALMHPDDVKPVWEKCQANLATHRAYSSEYRIIHRNGEIRWVWDQAHGIYSDSGELLHIEGLITDVTARKFAEEALRERELAYRTLVETSHDLIWSVDSQGRWTFVNAAARRIYGYEPAEMLGRPFMEFERPEQAQKDLEVFARIKAGTPYINYETEHRRKDGTPVWLSFNAVVRRDEQGRVLGTTGTAQDITERKQAEEALRANEERLRLALDAAEMGTYDWDIVHDKIVWSRSLEELFGYPPGEFGSTYEAFTQRVHPEDLPGINTEVARCIAERAPWGREFRVVWPDGSVHWVAGHGEFTYDDSGRAVRMRGVVREVTVHKLAEDALRESESKFRSIIEASPVPYALNDEQQNIIYLNTAFVETFGYHLEDIPTLADWWPKAYPDAAYRQWVATTWQVRLDKAKRAGTLFEPMELNIRRKDGTQRTAIVSAVPLAETFKGVHLVSLYDITARKEAEQHAEFLAQIIERSAMSVIITDRNGRIEYVNPKFTKVSGYTLEEAKGNTPSIVQSGLTADSIYRDMWETILSGREWHGILQNRHKNGELYWESDIIFPIADDSGEIVNFVALQEDISELKQYQERLAYETSHDQLTGLPNRTLFKDRVEQALAEARRDNGLAAVLSIDIDRFKPINDSLGTATGDTVLNLIVVSLTQCVREGDTVARIGDDEFAVLLPNVEDDAQISAVAQRIRETMAQPLPLDGADVTISVSTGISVYPQDGGDAEALMQNAETALQASKDAGGDTFNYFAAEMNERLRRKVAIDAALHRALEHNELLLHYQPVADLQSGNVTIMEALLRWQHPEQGMIPPAEFIPVAEESDRILVIGEWVMRTACQQVQAWREAGMQVPTLSVNISVRQLERPGLEQMVQRVLEETGLPPEQLKLELTETLLMRDPDYSRALLKRLKGLGVKLALDDFGTGYSSLSYLRSFPFDYLKLDRSFVNGLLDSVEAATIARTIIALAHDLGLKVIAEGVETREQMAYLRSRFCDEMQGYYFSKPLPTKEMGELILHRRELDITAGREGRQTLLLLDDDPAVLSAVYRSLQHEGYEILKTTSATEALRMLAEHPVGVVMSDQQMPEMLGVEFLNRVKALYPETVRIILSGHAEFSTVTNAINEGAVYKFLTKPWDNDMLRANLREAFRHHEILCENAKLKNELAMLRSER